MKKLFELFYIFFKIGSFTFGGGYAMLPIIKKELVENKKLILESELLDCYAVSQCAPGVIAVNTATYVGYKISGVLGAIFSTLGMVMPSFIIITIIAIFLKNFSQLSIFQHAFRAIRVAVAFLVINVIINLWKTTAHKNGYSLLIFVLIFFAFIFFKISPVYIVAGSVFLGILKYKNK